MSASFHSSRRIGLGTQIQPEALITASQSVDYNSRSQSPRGEEADEPQRIALAAKLLAILNDIATHGQVDLAETDETKTKTNAETKTETKTNKERVVKKVHVVV